MEEERKNRNGERLISFPFDDRPFVDQLCSPFERSMSCLRRRRISRSLPAVRVRKGEKISRSGQRRGTAVNGEEDLAGIKGGRMEERKTAFLPREFSVTLKSVFVPSDSHVPVEVHAPAGMQIANAPGVPKPILSPLFSSPLISSLQPGRGISYHRLDSRWWIGSTGTFFLPRFRPCFEKGREVITLYTLSLLVVVEFLSWIKVSRGNMLNSLNFWNLNWRRGSIFVIVGYRVWIKFGWILWKGILNEK